MPKYPMRPLAEAHLPTWLKIGLMEASRGGRTYMDLGHHLGKHIESFLSEAENPDGQLAALNEAPFPRPTHTLRRIFTTPAHPNGFPLVDHIPKARRLSVLLGLRCEITGFECPDCDRYLNR